MEAKSELQTQQLHAATEALQTSENERLQAVQSLAARDVTIQKQEQVAKVSSIQRVALVGYHLHLFSVLPGFARFTKQTLGTPSSSRRQG